MRVRLRWCRRRCCSDTACVRSNSAAHVSTVLNTVGTPAARRTRVTSLGCAPRQRRDLGVGESPLLVAQPPSAVERCQVDATRRVRFSRSMMPRNWCDEPPVDSRTFTTTSSTLAPAHMTSCRAKSRSGVATSQRRQSASSSRSENSEPRQGEAQLGLARGNGSPFATTRRSFFRSPSLRPRIASGYPTRAWRPATSQRPSEESWSPRSRSPVRNSRA